jgi:DNA-binding CsgD family transcriptional regulator
MKVSQNFTSEFPEKHGERWKYQSKSKGFPERPLWESPETQLRTYWTSTKMLPQTEPNPPKQRKKHKTKIRTKPMPAKNRYGLLALTARETEVLSLIAQGKTNYEIGVILSASTGTICKHVEHILCKLDVKNRTAAAVIALAAVARGAGRVSLRLGLFLSWIFSVFGGLTVMGVAT